MKIAIYLKKKSLEADPRFVKLFDDFKNEGCDICLAGDYRELSEDTDILVAVGGDGTFLSSAALVGDRNIPVLGVNLGRLGFLSEDKPETVVREIVAGNYTIEQRTLLKVSVECGTADMNMDDIYPYALNEVTVHRSGPAMLGVDVSIDGNPLPTYWADGLLVATSSGSTAYSLSVGGPIVMPESKVLIVSPISPHNLNVRPLVVPDGSAIDLSFKARDEKILLTIDNRSLEIDADTELSILMAQFSLKRVRLNNSNFINALTSKLFWGEDIRNN